MSRNLAKKNLENILNLQEEETNNLQKPMTKPKKAPATIKLQAEEEAHQNTRNSLNHALAKAQELEDLVIALKKSMAASDAAWDAEKTHVKHFKALLSKKESRWTDEKAELQTLVDSLRKDAEVSKAREKVTAKAHQEYMAEKDNIIIVLNRELKVERANETLLQSIITKSEQQDQKTRDEMSDLSIKYRNLRVACIAVNQLPWYKRTRATMTALIAAYL